MRRSIKGSRIWGAPVFGLAMVAMACSSPVEFGASQEESAGQLTQPLVSLPDTYPDPASGPCHGALAADKKTIYVATNGVDTLDSTKGTIATPLKSLAGARAWIKQRGLTRDYQVIVRGGTYNEQSVDWDATSNDHRVHIVAAAGEKPIFDGAPAGGTLSKLGYFIQIVPFGYLDPDSTIDPLAVATNVTISGLTIKNYVNFGVELRGQCNRLFNNRVLNTGSQFGDCKLIQRPGSTTRDWALNIPSCTVRDDCACEGYGAIDLKYTVNTLVLHNDVINALNDQSHNPLNPNCNSTDSKVGLMHGIYAATSSSGLFKDNFIHNVSGLPVKLRRIGSAAASANNTFSANYLDEGSVSNSACFGDNGKGLLDSTGTILDENVCTFPYTGSALSKLSLLGGDYTAVGDQDTAKYRQLTASPDEVITASVTADIDQDSKPEVFEAFYYQTLGFSKVVYSDGNNRDLRTVAYSKDNWKITAMTAIHPPGSSNLQIVTAFYLPLADQTQIWVGAKGSDGRYSLTGGTKLLDSSGASGWKVSALTAGKFAGDTDDRLITAALVGSSQQIWRGDGHTAQSGSSMPGIAGTNLYSNTNWRVTALANGAISGGSNLLITGFKWVGSGSPNNKIYTGDGVGGAAGTAIFTDGSKIVQALAVGKLGGSTPRLVSAFDGGQVYAWNGTTIGATALYSNSHWNITSLAVGQVDADADEELITALDESAKTEVYWGDGTTSGSGVLNGGAIYKTIDVAADSGAACTPLP